jgi:hypothetical protein
MVGRGHIKETVGLLNVNVFKCIEFTFNNSTVSLV